MRCIGPKAMDAKLLTVIWEELHGSPRRHTGGGGARQRTSHQEGNAHVLSEKFTTESNDNADEPAKEGARLD